MIHLRLRTEYSFRRAYGRVERVAAVARGGAITDTGAWGHVPWTAACKRIGVPCLLGAEVLMVDRPDDRQRQWGEHAGLVALTNDGLTDLYRALTLANREDHFYQVPRLAWTDLLGLRDVLILSSSNPPRHLLAELPNLHLEVSPSSGPWIKEALKLHSHYPLVATADNFVPQVEDLPALDVLTGRQSLRRTTIVHIPSEDELRLALGPNVPDEAYDASDQIAQRCTAVLPRAELVKYPSPEDLGVMCERGAHERGLWPMSEQYRKRLDRELKMIEEKQFADYFLVISDMVQAAKRTMLVGPARGSSAGSLVCYLLGITDVDPLKHGLMFERFIDITRADLPDIDIDFPDSQREDVMEYLKVKYGPERVGRIGTVNTYKAKSTINEVAVALHIPLWEVKDLSGAIIERSTGDSRAQFCIADTFHTLEVGKTMLSKYPGLRVAEKLEGHARHSGTHAAGYVITDRPLAQFSPIDRSGCIQMEKHAAEQLGIVKIDVLGLRTLSVLNDTLVQIGKDRQWLLSLPLDDEAAFSVFNRERFTGIFQFEGFALQSLTHQMGVESFDDIVAITTLARPGPLHGGATGDFIKRRTGKAPVVYLHPSLKDLTEESYGTVIYQEQVMMATRALGGLDWEDVSSLRKAMSKSLGEEFFNRYWEKFVLGARKQGLSDEDARTIWNSLCTFGCLSGDTVLRLPCANQHSPNTITLRDLYNNGGVGKVAEEKWNKQAQHGRRARLLTMDANGHLTPDTLVDVVASGVKTTWRVKLEDGKTLRATKDHRFWTHEGWQPLKQLAPGDVVGVVGEWCKPKDYKGTGSGAHNRRTGQSLLFLERVRELKQKYQTCQNCHTAPYQETHHMDEDRQNNTRENLLPCCRKCHKSFHISARRWSRGREVAWSEIVSIEDPHEEDTYDIAMASESHSFVANDMVVHNSWAFNKCVAAHTRIRMGATGGSIPEWMTIEELYSLYVANPTGWTQYRMPVLQSLYPDGRIRPQKAKHIYKTGAKKVNRYTFSNGVSVVCTPEHQFIVDGEWRPIGEVGVGAGVLFGENDRTLKKGTGRDHAKGKPYGAPHSGFPTGPNNPSYINGKTPAADEFRQAHQGQSCQVCGTTHHRMEIHHHDMNGGLDRPDAMAWLCPGCHKEIHYKAGRTRRWGKGHAVVEVKLVSIEPAGRAETYDIEMEHHPNYIAEGAVVHNSHAVSYAYLSYWCAYLKAHHPVEFAAAALRHAKDEEQTVHLLRELVKEGIPYMVVDPSRSEAEWTVKDGQLLGGLTAIKGIGKVLAADILKRRAEGRPLTKGQASKLANPVTPYDNIFEGTTRWRDYYEHPERHGILSRRPVEIATIQKPGTYIFLARIVEKNLRDANELGNVVKRGGKRVEGPSVFLNLTLEDDSGKIIATITRFDYAELGKPLVEGAKVGEWFVWKGDIRNEWRMVQVKRWRRCE